MIMIVSDSNNLMIYENISLKWVSNLEFTPVAISRINIQVRKYIFESSPCTDLNKLFKTIFEFFFIIKSFTCSTTLYISYLQYISIFLILYLHILCNLLGVIGIHSLSHSSNYIINVLMPFNWKKSVLLIILFYFSGIPRGFSFIIRFRTSSMLLSGD